MPSYEVAAAERPITPATAVPGPARQLAQRKNATGAGRPPNPLCCGRPTKRIATGSSIVRCQVCENTYSPGDQLPKQPAISDGAAGRSGPKPPSMLGAGLSEREAEQLRQKLNTGATAVLEVPAALPPNLSDSPLPSSAPCRKCPGTCLPREMAPSKHAVREVMFICTECGSCGAVWADDRPAPGLDGDHATRAEERSKIPPSRPANNSRGPRGATPRYEIRTTPPPPSIGLGRNTGLAEAIRDLPTDGSAWLCVPPDDLTAARVRDAVRRLKVRGRILDVTHYLAADRSCRVVIRRPKAEGEASR